MNLSVRSLKSLLFFVPFLFASYSYAEITADPVVNGVVRLHWVALEPTGSDWDNWYTTITEKYPGANGQTQVMSDTDEAGILELSREPGEYLYELESCWTEYEFNDEYDVCSNIESVSVTISVSGPGHELGVFNAPPVIQIASPAAGQNYQPSSNLFKANVSDSNGLNNVSFYIDDTLIYSSSSNGPNFQTNYNLQNLSLGYHRYTVVASDSFNNTSTQSVVFLLNTEDAGAQLPNNTQAIDLTKYDIYYGDADEDGIDGDIYFAGKDVFVLLHGDIVTPILIPGAPGFMYSSDGIGGYSSPWQIDLTKTQLAELQKAEEGVDFIYGDLNGDGSNDIFVRGQNLFESSAVISGTIGEDLPQILFSVDSAGRVTSTKMGVQSEITFAANLSDRNTVVSLSAGTITVNGVAYAYDSQKQTATNLAKASELAQSITPSYQTPSLDASGQQALDQIRGLGGEFKVSESGASTYTVPIQIAAGTAGVAPEVSVSYNSQSGEGLMGIGWSLSASGAISRCRQTLLVDKKVSPVAFNTEDRFCLNGQRLLLMDSSATYGSPGTKYRTEIESFNVVEIIGDSSGNVDYFKVTGKDGSTSYYGYPGVHDSEWKGRNESNQVQNTKVSTWAQSRFKDNMGNTIVYEYSQAELHFRLKEIKYAYSSTGLSPTQPSANSTHFARVEFKYDADDDRGLRYYGGYVFKDYSRLNSVISYSQTESSGEQLLREYKFGYDEGSSNYAGDDRKRLTSIRECVGEVCLPSLWFAWGYTPTPFTFSSSNTLQADTDNTIVNHAFGDFNGDGRLDIFYVELKADQNFSFGYAYQEDDGGFTKQSTWSFNKSGSVTSDISNLRIVPIDVNADGRTDVAFYRPNAGWKLYNATPTQSAGWSLNLSGFSIPSTDKDLKFADLNSDGLVDAFRFSGNQIERYQLSRDGSQASGSAFAYKYVELNPISTNISLNPKTVTPADINGDGVLDFVGVEMTYENENSYTISGSSPYPGYPPVVIPVVECDRYDKLYVGLSSFDATSVSWQQIDSKYSDGVVYQGQNSCSYVVENKSVPAYGNITPSDINGDGVTDLIFGEREISQAPIDPDTAVNFDNIVYRLGRGNNTYATPVDMAITGVNYFSVLDHDVDGDADLYFEKNSSNTTQLLLKKWDFNGFEQNDSILDSSVGENQSIHFFDVTGDGSYDRVTSSGSYITVSKGQPTHLRNQIIAFHGGHGAKTEVIYEPLSLSDHYNRIEGFSNVTIPYEWEGTHSGGGTYTVTGTKTVVDSTAFYEGINAPFADLPQGTEFLTLNQTAPVFEFMGPMQVVTKVESTSPSFDKTENDVVPTKAAVMYFYEQAKIQAGGRGFLGFKKLTTLDMQTAIQTSTTYRQDWPFTGAPLLTETKTADGHLLSQSTSESRAVVPNSTSATNGASVSITAKESQALSSGTKALGPVQLYTHKTVDRSYAYREGQNSQGEQLKVTEVETAAPDRFGNVLNITTVYKNGAEQQVSSTDVVNNYHNSSNLPLAQGRLSKSTVTTTRTGQTTQIREAHFDYYGGNTSGCTGSNHKGMICKEWVTVNDTSNDSLVTQHFYDDFGNKIYQKLVADAGTRVSGITEFDSAGRYPVATYGAFTAGASDALPSGGNYSSAMSGVDGVVQKTSEVVLRDKHGIPLQVHSYVGSNQYVVARSAVTPFGNIYFKAGSDGAGSRTRASFDVSQCPNNVGAKYVVTSQGFDGSYSGACFDVLDREVSTFKKEFNGQLSYVDTHYDLLSRVVAVSEPYTGSASQWTETVYDSIGRPVQSLHPFNLVKTTSSKSDMDSLGSDLNIRAMSTVEYNGLETIFTNASNNVKKELSNVMGEVVKVTEVANGASHGNRYADYVFDANGNLTYVTANGNNATKIEMVHNVLGRKVSMDDPDKGEWEYKYNGFGEMICQRDAESNVIVSDYDIAGRLISRKDYENTNCNSPNQNNLTASASWVYDTAANGLGSVASEQDDISQYAKYYSYDSLGRAVETVEEFPGVNNVSSRHYQKVTFDALGRSHQQFDAARVSNVFNNNGTKNVYNQHGYLHKVVNAANNSEVYYEVLGTNHRGQVTGHTVGANVTVETEYNESTGAIESIQSEYSNNTTNTTLQSLFLKWDHLGNLLYRNETKFGNGKERYEYDEFNQLRKAYFVNGSNETLTETQYDSLGNFTNKTGVGSYSYSYSGAGPHAVTQAGSNSFVYDSNGNVVQDKIGSSIERDFVYNAFNKLEKVERTAKARAEFYYGTGRSRFKRVDTNLSNNKVTTTLYAGSVEKIYYDNGIIEWKRNIAGVGQITLEVNSSGVVQEETKEYFLKDHLGSISQIVDANGMVQQSMAFDPWGQRRNLNDDGPVSSSVLASFNKDAKPKTTRGFTGHEMVDAVGIIHMNGRIYDDKLGRFLQADPFIQSPKAMVSLNRYAYGWNNPLNSTDPSGYISWSDINPIAKINDLSKSTRRSILKTLGPELSGLVVAVASYYCGPLYYLCAAAGNYQIARAFGASSQDAFKAGAIAGVSAVAFSAIGQTFNADSGFFKQGGYGHILAHGVTGGVLSVLQGGKFGHGFVSAGITKMLAPAYANIDSLMIGDISVTQAVVAALIGGTMSEMTGGKFANGAKTAAFANIYNQQKSAYEEGRRWQPRLGVPPEDEDKVALLESLATEAAAEVDANCGLGCKLLPFERGRRIHKLFEYKVKMAGGYYDAEVSYLDGRRVSYGTAGSSRADAIYGLHVSPDFAVELKTGWFAFVSDNQIDNYMKNLPEDTKLYFIWVK